MKIKNIPWIIVLTGGLFLIASCTSIQNGTIEPEKTPTEAESEPEKKEFSEDTQKSENPEPKTQEIINPLGETIQMRYNPPTGFERIAQDAGSYGEYLRTRLLKPHGAKVYFHDGRPKTKPNVYDGVLDVQIGDRDLHQCADAIMLLRAEYLYQQKEYESIRFHFVSGFLAEYSKWVEGNRIDPESGYYPGGTPGDYSYETFREYMNMVFAYAGTLSMLGEAEKISLDDMQIGDIFLDKGHTIIVMDMAEDKDGNRRFLLAQSYMPAQETQILVNRKEPEISPWYSLEQLKEDGILITPEWKFNSTDLMRYR